jgi:hypothetical protein
LIGYQDIRRSEDRGRLAIDLSPIPSTGVRPMSGQLLILAFMIAVAMASLIAM